MNGWCCSLKPSSVKEQLVELREIQYSFKIAVTLSVIGEKPCVTLQLSGLSLVW